MNALDSVPLFIGLDDRQRALIWERMVLESRKAGEHLFQQDELAKKLYLIKSGWVRLVGDQRMVLASLSQGSLLGDADVMLGHNYGTTAEAVTAVEAWALAGEDIADLVAQEPEIGLRLSDYYQASVLPLLRYLVERRLHPLPGFAELPEDVLMATAARLCSHPARAREVLFAAGSAPSNIYILEQGSVTMGEPGGTGGSCGPGDLIADRNVLLGRAYTLTAIADGDSLLWELSVADLDRLCGLYPELRATLGQALQARLSPADQARAVGLLRATPIFESLPAEPLNDLAARLVCQIAAPGTRLFEADTAGDGMYFVDGGGVELLNQRNEALARISSGGYFGESGLLGSAPYGFAARTRGNTTLWVLSRAAVISAAQRYPAIGRAVAQQLAADQVSAEEHFAERHLRRLSLFAGLTQDQLREVAGHLQEAHFRPGQPIYRRGDAGEAMYLIEQGRVAVQTRTAEGQARPLASMSSGESVGETALLTGEPHATDAVAQTDVDAWKLTREDFEGLVARYPVLGLNLSRMLSYRLRQSNEQAADAAGGISAAAVVGGAAVAGAAMGSAAAAPGVAKAAAVPARKAPAKAATPAAPAAQQPSALAARVEWFKGLRTSRKIELVALAVLLLWLIIAVPVALAISVISNNNAQHTTQSGKGGFLESAVLVALAANSDQALDATATFTPWPTDTPIPSPTPTYTPVPTATNTPLPPTATVPPPTATRAPTRIPVRVVPTAAPAAPAVVEQAAVAVRAAPPPTAVPKPAQASRKYAIQDLHHLTGCENGWNHNIFVKVVDPGGNPIDGVKLLVRSADMNGENLGVMVTGHKGPGLDEIPIYKDGAYAVFVTENGNDPADSDVARPLSSVRDLNGEVWPAEKCGNDNGNTIGHNSWRVTFVKNS